MSNTKQVHYSIDNITNENAQINLIWGERSNGKSYQVKHKKAVLKYLETKKRFILMRRWKEEITTEKIEQYFQDVDIYSITNGEFNCITMYKKQLYLANYNNATGKTTKADKIGYVVALSTEQNYAGASYLDVEDIIFEEFMSRSTYISNEPDKLMNFYSTVDRKRGTTKLWLVGNTISRVCPYIEDWDLRNIISNQKQGTIELKYISTDTYDDNGNEIKVKIAVEYCESTGKSSFAIGKHKDMLNTGSWQSDPQPHLPKSYNDYKLIFKFGFQYQSFKFLCDYLLDVDSKDTCWFIYPYNKEFDKDLIIFSDIVKVDKHWQRDIYNPSFNNKRLKDLFYTFRENKIFYANDLCGTDFKQVIDFEIRR